MCDNCERKYQCITQADDDFHIPVRIGVEVYFRHATINSLSILLTCSHNFTACERGFIRYCWRCKSDFFSSE